MPSSTFWGFQHLNCNVLCSVVVDTYGPDPDFGPAEICILPLDHMLQPHPEILLFNMRVKPDDINNIDWKHCRLTRPEVAQVQLRGYDKYQVGDMLYTWFKTLDLNFRKRIMPLGYRFHEAYPVLRDLLGSTAYDEVFDGNYRDLQVAANYANDMAGCRSDPVPFAKQNLRWICKTLNLPPIEQGGSASLDALQIAQAYRRIVSL